MRQPHSISTLVNRMAIQGLVKKIRNASDARQLNLMITEKGEALFKSVTKNSITEIFSTLSECDQKTLTAGLRKLMLSAYEALGKTFQNNVLL
jgi:DNA-binding MarR family transcriptional regulator